MLAQTGSRAVKPWRSARPTMRKPACSSCGRCRPATIPEVSQQELSEPARLLDLSGRRLFRAIRPDAVPRFERRFETQPCEQAQADFAEFKTDFADEPAASSESKAKATDSESTWTSFPNMSAPTH